MLLEQVKSADLPYDAQGKLTAGVTEIGMLDETAVKYVRCNTWHGSNAAEAVGNVSIVLFTGGEDISPNLYYQPEEWHGIEAEIDYNAERDVSDYLTMAYCLDSDIPLMGFCRGNQMLAVVSGGEMIQDIPTWFAEQGIAYDYTHRNQKAAPDAYRDYAPHEVQVAEGSLLYEMVGTTALSGCPSWHHQAVKNVDNTRLIVTGYTETNGVQMIEALERTDKTFAIGIQFHPEAAIVKNLDDAGNKADYIDYETSYYFKVGTNASSDYIIKIETSVHSSYMPDYQLDFLKPCPRHPCPRKETVKQSDDYIEPSLKLKHITFHALEDTLGHAYFFAQ